MTPPGRSGEELVRRVRALIVDVPDFPVPGIAFRDVLPVLAEHDTFSAVVARAAADLAAAPHLAGVDVVVGIEARGFLLAAPIALAAGLGVVVVRKPGKLPGPLWRTDYQLEYGHGALEVQRTAIGPGQRVLLVDDVLATGGTLGAAARLVALAGGTVAGAWVLVELAALGGRDHVPARVNALVTA